MRQFLVLAFALVLLLGSPSLIGAHEFPGDAAHSHEATCTDYCIKMNAEVQRARHADPPEEPNFSSIFSPPSTTCICNPLQAKGLFDVITPILNFLFNIALVLAPLMIVVAGILFVTATGDPAKISRAKQMLIWTGVGFGIILLAKGLIAVLRAIIGF